MRLMRVGPVGAERPAVWRASDLALDVSGVVSDFDPTFLEGDGLQRLDDVLATAPVDLPDIDLTMTRIGAPLSRPGKVVCIGLNYREHAVETGMALPPEPIVFLKTASTVVGPNDDVLIPPGSEKTDYEVELAVVIGRTARYLPDTAVALDHVAGFAISNDVSERAYHGDVVEVSIAQLGQQRQIFRSAEVRA